MGGRLLVFCVWAGIWANIYNSGEEHQRTVVAPQASQDEAKVQELHQQGFFGGSWEEDSEKTEEVYLAHWSAVWTQPKRRSRSKSVKAASSYKATEEQKPQKEGTDWAVFPVKAPWIPTTPSSRVMKKEETTDGAGCNAATAQSVVQPPNVEDTELTLTVEEEKLLEHLRALQNANLDLTESMQRKLEVHLAKQQNGNMIKPLNHGHLNRLRKVKTQVNNAGKRIAELDQEWSSFVDKTMSKVKEHASMYQSCRADMLETYNKKLAELESLKRELSTASMQMLATDPQEPVQVTVPDVGMQMQAMQEVVDLESVVGPVDLTEDMEEDEEPLGTGRGQNFKNSPKVHKGFRGATSPTKVANQHLKIKSHDSKENKAKD
ncbi:unnamed protein product [Cladocopium goreaui]|uniref:Uncharacterized protein n=1 Tax=Cladocopium goreaui TaxID=2562237 RepID=A0A9P1BNU5_9DINO|nr:unnamed protein product [Cladocopium goreaui]